MSRELYLKLIQKIGYHYALVRAFQQDTKRVQGAAYYLVTTDAMEELHNSAFELAELKRELVKNTK